MQELTTTHSALTATGAKISREFPEALTSGTSETKCLSSTAGDKKTTWPISCDPEGRVEFAPLGGYGSRYFIPDIATRDRVALRAGMAIQGFSLAAALLRLADGAYDGLGPSRYQRVFADTLTSYLMVPAFVFAVWFLFCQSRGLTLASKRPPFRQACRIFANRRKPIQLYVIQAIAIGFAALGVMELSCRTVVIRSVAIATGSTLLACVVAITLFCCWLFSLRTE